MFKLIRKFINKIRNRVNQKWNPAGVDDEFEYIRKHSNSAVFYINNDRSVVNAVRTIKGMRSPDNVIFRISDIWTFFKYFSSYADCVSKGSYISRFKSTSIYENLRDLTRESKFLSRDELYDSITWLRNTYGKIPKMVILLDNLEFDQFRMIDEYNRIYKDVWELFDYIIVRNQNQDVKFIDCWERSSQNYAYDYDDPKSDFGILKYPDRYNITFNYAC